MELGGWQEGARLGVNKWADTQHVEDAWVLPMQLCEVLQDVGAHLLPGVRSNAVEPAQEVSPVHISGMESLHGSHAKWQPIYKLAAKHCLYGKNLCNHHQMGITQDQNACRTQVQASTVGLLYWIPFNAARNQSNVKVHMKTSNSSA